MPALYVCTVAGRAQRAPMLRPTYCDSTCHCVHRGATTVHMYAGRQGNLIGTVANLGTTARTAHKRGRWEAHAAGLSAVRTTPLGYGAFLLPLHPTGHSIAS